MTGTKENKKNEEPKTKAKPKAERVVVVEADVKTESKTDAKHKVSLVDEPEVGSSGSSSTTTKSIVSHESVEGEEEGREHSQQIGNSPLAAIHVDRVEYLSAHRELTLERQHQQVLNNILHRRLAEYYKKRKCEHVLKPLEGAMDMEEKYQQKLLSYQELKEKAEREIADIKKKVTEVEETYGGRLEHAEKKFDELQHLERSTGSGLIYSRKGKPIANKTVERFLTLQRRKSEQSSALCLRYIRARNAVAELEAIVKNLETLGPGLYVYQYEQLNIDNQNYNTKIEEREDELIKNRTKCTEHNQILAHIREKMHHTDEVIDFAECDLGDAEMEFYRAREDLGMIKSRRNKLRWSLEEERLKAGLLTRKDLLRDFQASLDEVVHLGQRKKQLEAQVLKASKELRHARKHVLAQSNLHRHM
ncbi:coiled-coil domain-containing protein 96 [Spodoptera frugiperda]|uniref:Coiled-coil domain-containing protein 96 n=1 Tax=Spodoptera frugiperda TaxID=7108 RepID=A0A9R0F3W2_SPOFR|nr:coiled-coil domain-containing protein 96 [Spodoptera frugiperda]